MHRRCAHGKCGHHSGIGGGSLERACFIVHASLVYRIRWIGRYGGERSLHGNAFRCCTHDIANRVAGIVLFVLGHCFRVDVPIRIVLVQMVFVEAKEVGWLAVGWAVVVSFIILLCIARAVCVFD